MKNLKEVQAQYDLLKAEAEGVRARLAVARAGLPFLFTVDTVYQTERHLNMLNVQLATLSWVAA